MCAEMEYVRIVLQDMPVSVKGFTVYNFDDDGMAYYTIFINARLSDQAQCAVYDHEIRHINNNDFDRMHAYTADNLEAMRHVV